MFGGDPFDPFGTRRHMRQMEQMMDSMMTDMMNPFGMMDSFFAGHPSQNMIEDGRTRRRSSGRPNANNQIASPFDFGMGMFGNMMGQMQGLQNEAMNSPNSHVFTQSTMISYDGSGRPKVVSNSVRKTGDVKETRRTVRDGDREEISVGHAIGDREHIIEKKRDKDGKVRKNQKFIGLDESEAETFNSEFKTRAQRNMNGFFNGREEPQYKAIGNGHSSSSSRNRAALEDDDVVYSGQRASKSSKNTQPIIEVPDDDDDDIEILSSNVNRHRGSKYSHNGNSGPIISEVTDEDGTSSKRRKGMFGRFFANDD